MTYCDVNLVRAISGLDNTEIRDSRIQELRDEVAIGRLNTDVQTRVEAEELDDISHSRLNSKNGENKDFYLESMYNNYRSLGDLNDDGKVDSNDIKVWSVLDGDRQTVEVDEIIDPDEGHFRTVDPVRKNADLYASYRHCPVNASRPNQMMAVACAQLTGAFCFSNIETAKLKDFSIGDVAIRKQSDGFAIMMDQYTESMRRIVNRELIKFGENENEIVDVIEDAYAGDRPLGEGKDTISGRFRSG
jgi:hypothetical protein